MGRSLGFHGPFFYKLVGVLADTMGHVFPEVRANKSTSKRLFQREEEAFNKTLDRGIELFREETECLQTGQLKGEFAFKLYDTYGFPLDLTELMARERGLTVDAAGFNRLMDEQKARARAAQKKQIIELSQVESEAATNFVGYDQLDVQSRNPGGRGLKEKTAVIVETSPCYAEMGGQVATPARSLAAESFGTSPIPKNSGTPRCISWTPVRW
jgi:alanyl-tRNA synthetase